MPGLSLSLFGNGAEQEESAVPRPQKRRKTDVVWGRGKVTHYTILSDGTVVGHDGSMAAQQWAAEQERRTGTR